MAWPQSLQNLAVRRLGSPQFGQAISSRTPHSSQKAELEEFSWWHRGQFIVRFVRSLNPQLPLFVKGRVTRWRDVLSHRHSTRQKQKQVLHTTEMLTACPNR